MQRRITGATEPEEIIINTRQHLFNRAAVEEIILREGVTFPEIMRTIRSHTINQEKTQLGMQVSAKNLCDEMNKAAAQIFEADRRAIGVPSTTTINNMSTLERMIPSVEGMAALLIEVFKFGVDIASALQAAEDRYLSGPETKKSSKRTAGRGR